MTTGRISRTVGVATQTTLWEMEMDEAKRRDLAAMQEALIARKREPLAAREAAQELADRVASPAGNANVLLETIEGLVELNLTLIELLIQAKAMPEEHVTAAITEASEKIDGGMGRYILGSVLAYLQDSDNRMVRMAKVARSVRRGRWPSP